MIFRSFYVSICYKDLIDLHYKHQNIITEISASAAESLNKTELFFLHIFTVSDYMCPWSTKAVLSNTGIFVAIANNTLYGSKLSIFLLCQKSLGY